MCIYTYKVFCDFYCINLLIVPVMTKRSYKLFIVIIIIIVIFSTLPLVLCVPTVYIRVKNVCQKVKSLLVAWLYREIPHTINEIKLLCFNENKYCNITKLWKRPERCENSDYYRDCSSILLLVFRRSVLIARVSIIQT